MEQHLLKVSDHSDHSDYYLINTKTGECMCFDYIWNGPFRDVCKHCHAALIYKEAIKSSDIFILNKILKKNWYNILKISRGYYL
jgi:hypothetical protein